MTISATPDAMESSRGPRAPTQEEWDAMTPAERVRAADALPVYVPPEECGAMEGDRHNLCSQAAIGALRTFFETTGRDVYVSGEMAVYLPGRFRVSPDVFAVVGAEQRSRDSWIVTREGRRPEWVLEVLALGDRWKDLKGHVVAYAEHGIREYFIADLVRRRLRGYRLADASIGIYTPIVPQVGRYRSEVLDLDLALDGEKVHFYHGSARLLEPAEIAEELRDRLNDEQMQRRDAEERASTAEERASTAEERASTAEERASAEAAARANLESELALMRAELERLRRG